jgi:hypothetical protein
MEYQNNLEDAEKFSVPEAKDWDGEPQLPNEVMTSLGRLFIKYYIPEKDKANWLKAANWLYRDTVANYILSQEHDGIIVNKIDRDAHEGILANVAYELDAAMKNPDNLKNYISAARFFGKDEEGHDIRDVIIFPTDEE